jgi:hypothetical protein
MTPDKPTPEVWALLPRILRPFSRQAKPAFVTDSALVVNTDVSSSPHNAQA